MELIIKIEGLEETIRSMTALEKQEVPFALAKALTQTAQEIKAETVKEIERKIDRPKPYTLRSMYIKMAKKTDYPRAEAVVGFKDATYAAGTPASVYMRPAVTGDDRNVKRFEAALQAAGILPKGMYVVPGAACPLDLYGNIKPSFIVQILSYFRAFGEQGYKANITDKRKARLAKGNAKKGIEGYSYFVSSGGQVNYHTRHLEPGIYRRSGASGQIIRPVMIFVRKPKYTKRIPFFEIAQKTVDKNFKTHFYKALYAAVSHTR